MRRGHHPDAGLTLIELIVAMALFALVAAMGLQVLNGMLRARDRLVTRSDDTSALSLTLALLRQDLQAAVPMGFSAPGVPPAPPLTTTPGPRLALSLAGQSGPGIPEHAGFHRVIWRYDRAARQLTRQIWPSLSPATASQLQPAIPVLTGVQGLEIRLFRPDQGWLDWRDLPVDVIRTDLPAAIEVTLDTAVFGRVRLVETLW
ncbi:prepilin-type N-terminal cleavage/methylation domain-containing protein [Seohaeicola saemankumensis]|nr:type II secretion system protein GspJ [Seohaeicola saemankumensis]MCA0873488.1 prepilin-type N-terminal cleavage/methylation domain-containing protein [Seohaeicola saemankumensis]